MSNAMQETNIYLIRVAPCDTMHSSSDDITVDISNREDNNKNKLQLYTGLCEKIKMSCDDSQNTTFISDKNWCDIHKLLCKN